MIAVVNERTVNQKRALRIRTVRGMLNMTVAEFARLIGYAEPTVSQWERNPLTGLTAKGARNIINALKRTSVVTSLSWLLHGEGLPPFIRSENEVIAKYQQELVGLSGGVDSATYTKNEIERFEAFIPGAITLQVPDDSMEPYYLVGEFVGGKQLQEEALQHALGKVCIVKLADGRLLLRKLFKDDQHPQKYKLTHFNSQARVEPTNNISIMSAAPVARVWRHIIE